MMKRIRGLRHWALLGAVKEKTFEAGQGFARECERRSFDSLFCFLDASAPSILLSLFK